MLFYKYGDLFKKALFTEIDAYILLLKLICLPMAVHVKVSIYVKDMHYQWYSCPM